MTERSRFLIRIFAPHVIVCCAALIIVYDKGCKPNVYWLPACVAVWPLVARLFGRLRNTHRDYLASLMVISLATLAADAIAGFTAFVVCGRIG
jgi:hypothetical protein